MSERDCRRRCRSTPRSAAARSRGRMHGRATRPWCPDMPAPATAFEEAISAFAVAYADQTEKDWNGFLAAIKAGRIDAAAPETGKS